MKVKGINCSGHGQLFELWSWRLDASKDKCGFKLYFISHYSFLLP